jgi:hypothetical protein
MNHSSSSAPFGRGAAFDYFCLFQQTKPKIQKPWNTWISDPIEQTVPLSPGDHDLSVCKAL